MNPYNQDFPPPISKSSPVPMRRRELRYSANLAGIGMILITAVALLFRELFGVVFPLIREQIPSQSMTAFLYAFSLIVFCIAFIVPCVFMSFWLRIPARIAYPMRAPRIGVLFAAIGICIGARLVGALLVTRMSGLMELITGGYTPTMPYFPTPEETGVFIIYVINVVIAASVFEELLFRGVMLQSLRRFGDHFAVVTTSILFALMHGNLLQGPYALVLGLLIGYFVVYTGSLWTGIIMHAAHNLISVLFGYFMNNMSEANFEALASIFFIASILLAVLALVYLRSKYGSVFYLRRGSFPLKERQKHFAFFTSPFVLIAIGIAIYEIVGHFA